MVLHIHSRVHFNSEFRINLVSRNICVKIISYCAYFTKLNYHECYSHGALLTRNFSKLQYLHIVLSLYLVGDYMKGVLYLKLT